VVSFANGSGFTFLAPWLHVLNSMAKVKITQWPERLAMWAALHWEPCPGIRHPDGERTNAMPVSS